MERNVYIRNNGYYDAIYAPQIYMEDNRIKKRKNYTNSNINANYKPVNSVILRRIHLSKSFRKLYKSYTEKIIYH